MEGKRDLKTIILNLFLVYIHPSNQSDSKINLLLEIKVFIYVRNTFSSKQIQWTPKANQMLRQLVDKQ